MNKNRIIILIGIALFAGMLVLAPSFAKANSEIADSSASPNTIKLELPEFEKKFTKTSGEYTVEAQKWRGGTLGGFGVWLYKNGQQVDKDSYLSRAYFCMDGEWKWSGWGDGEGATYHKYPVSDGVEIKEVEVRF